MATTKETQPTKLTAAQLKKKVETQEEKIKSLKEGAWCYMCDTHKAKDKFYVSTDPMSKSGLILTYMYHIFKICKVERDFNFVNIILENKEIEVMIYFDHDLIQYHLLLFPDTSTRLDLSNLVILHKVMNVCDTICESQNGLVAIIF